MRFRFLIFSTLLIVLVTSTSLALIQTSKSIPSFGTISIPPVGQAAFGVNVQYYDDAEVQTYFPDLWTLVNYVGATHLIGAPRREWADAAASHGIKIMFTFGVASSPESMMDAYKSRENMKAHLDLYNIPQYRDHPGVWAYNICCEPFNNWDATTDNLVDVLLYGIQYIKSLDPTHPVTVQLCPAGAWYAGWTLPDSVINQRKQWISRFIDAVDFLTYNFYPFSKNGIWCYSGDEFWRAPQECRNLIITQLDRVLIPASKGKPIVIGETGCPCPTPEVGDGTFTEDQQAEYFRIFGEETKKRGIFVVQYKLVDVIGQTTGLYGLFKADKSLTMNIPKKAASLVKNYLSTSIKI